MNPSAPTPPAAGRPASRTMGLDTLRVLGALAVVTLHVSAVAVTTDPGWTHANWWIGNVVDAYSRWCVPVFVMVSGALLLQQPSDLDPRGFYRRRVARLFLPLLFWSLFYLAWPVIKTRQWDGAAALRALASGTPYFHLWYLFMTLGVYAVTPFLRRLVQGCSDNFLRWLLAVGFSLAAAEALLRAVTGGAAPNALGLWPPYVTYFMAGYAVTTTPLLDRWTGRRLAWTVVVSGALIAGFTGGLWPLLGARAWEVMYSYFNPFVIVMAGAVFAGVGRVPEPVYAAHPRLTAGIRHLAPLTLGIYLIHPLWMDLFAHLGLQAGRGNAALTLPATVLAVLSASWGSAWVLSQVPGLRRVIR